MMTLLVWAEMNSAEVCFT